MKPIYVPKGAAKEYGDYCVNIYTGCPHRCYYCYAPRTLHIEKEVFHSRVEPRRNIVEETRKQLERDETLRGKLIHLCFTCDPYPAGYDTSVTRHIIQLLKEYRNHVQILTKGNGTRDFDLLDENDWYGVTISCNTGMAKAKEPYAISPKVRLDHLEKAKEAGIKTWVSFEPVEDGEAVISCIAGYFDLFDKIKIGKLNYYSSTIDWGYFGRIAESVCRETGVDYYIKDGLRKCMV